MAQIKTLVGVIASTEAKQRKIVHDCEVRTKALIDKRWTDVEAVAHVLISKGSMTGQELVSLLTRDWGCSR